MKLKGGGVHAIPLASRSWAIVEDMAQVGITYGAEDFGAYHEMTEVPFGSNIFSLGRGRKARPPGTRVILGGGGKQLGPTTDAGVDSGRFVVMVFSGKGALGTVFAGHLVLLGGELLLPLCVGLLDFFNHGPIDPGVS